jgi:hypothetical protein
MNDDALRHKFLCEYNGHGQFDAFKNRFYKQQNDWRRLTFESLQYFVLKEENEDSDERNKVIQLIKNNNFVINNTEAFYNAASKTKKKEMLTDYSDREYKEMTTYLLNGYDIGYAVKNDGDIVSVLNNRGFLNLVAELIKSAIKNGGTKLDHYDGFLSKLYEPLGFKEYDRAKWDDQYHQNDNWDYKKYGRPDVIWRKLDTHNKD